MSSQWSFFSQERVGDSLIINALEFDLKREASEVLGLIVYADTVRITSPIRLPGKNVFIHARRIICDENGAIDLSGLDQKDHLQVTNGNSGKNGLDGDPGKPGSSGGSIRVFSGSIEGTLAIDVHGGRGGRGQDGANGIQGDKGTEGRNAQTRYWKQNDLNSGKYTGETGGKGGTGGNGGRGGPGGHGGDAGTIEVHVIEPTGFTLRLNGEGGRRGESGTNGKAGAGGPAGLGGTNWLFHKGNTHVDEWWQELNERAAGSIPGDPGADANQPLSGEDGISHTDYPAYLIPGSSQVLGANASLPQLLMLLNRAESDYLSEPPNYQCAQTLAWLEYLTQLSSGTEPTEWFALRQRVVGLLTQLNAGLNYYGYAHDYVSLVDREVFKQTIDRLRPLVENIEHAHEDYQAAEGKIEEQRAKLEEIIERAQVEINGFEKQIDEKDKLAQAAYEEMIALEAAMINLENPLIDQSHQFEKAIEEHLGQGCTPLDALLFIAAVITVAAGAYAAIAEIVNSVKGSVDAIEKIKGAIRILKIAGSSMEQIKQDYGEVKDKVANHSNEVKLVILGDDFRKVLDDFERKIDQLVLDDPDLQEAASAYKQLVRQYVLTAQARSTKAMDFTSLRNDRDNLEAAKSQRQQELERIRLKLAENSDTGLVEYDAFVTGLLLQAKNNLLRVLYQYKKSVEYWYMDDIYVPLRNTTVADIDYAYQEIANAELKEMEERNSSSLQLPPTEVILSDRQNGNPATIFIPEAFERFRQMVDNRNVLTFSISPYHLAFQRPWAGIRVSDVKVEVKGARTEDHVLSMELIHSGDATFAVSRNSSGDLRLVHYSHKPRICPITYNLDSGPLPRNVEDNLGGGEGYSYLSPFSVWHLSLAAIDNRTLNIEDVHEVILTFGGSFVPFVS